EKMAETGERDAAGAWGVGARGKVVAMQRGDEEEGTDAFVEIGFAAAVGVEFGARGEEFVDGFAGGPAIEGEVARGGVGGVDDVEEAKRHGEEGAGSRGQGAGAGGVNSCSLPLAPCSAPISRR